jgi:hypothetical protein
MFNYYFYSFISSKPFLNSDFLSLDETLELLLYAFDLALLFSSGST